MPARGRGTSPSKLGDLLGLCIIDTVGYALLRQTVPAPLLAFLILCTVGVWVLLFMPTFCDTQLRHKPHLYCTRPVRGKLRGCKQYHRRDKRDAVYASLLRMRNPGMFFRTLWVPPAASAVRSGRSGSTHTDPGAGSGPRTDPKAGYDALMLVLTAVGSVAGIAGALFAALAVKS